MTWAAIKRPVKLVLGWILFIAGLIIAPMPIPIGQITALIGLSLLVSESRAIRRWIQILRIKWPYLSRQMKKIHPHMPKFIKKVIERTDPRFLATRAA